MQKDHKRIKGFIPIKIYQSPSSLYMTCVTKIPRDEQLSPLDYQKRQQEAREILLRSQEILLNKMGLKEDTSDEESCPSEDDTDTGELREPIRLKSEILLSEYKKRYEPEPKPKPALKDLWPMEELKSGLSLILSFCLMACSFCALIMIGHENYFL